MYYFLVQIASQTFSVRYRLDSSWPHESSLKRRDPKLSKWENSLLYGKFHKVFKRIFGMFFEIEIWNSVFGWYPQTMMWIGLNFSKKKRFKHFSSWMIELLITTFLIILSKTFMMTRNWIFLGSFLFCTSFHRRLWKYPNTAWWRWRRHKRSWTPTSCEFDFLCSIVSHKG